MLCRLCGNDHELERARFVCKSCGGVFCWESWHAVEQSPRKVGEHIITDGVHPVGDDWCGYLIRQISDDDQLNAEVVGAIVYNVIESLGVEAGDLVVVDHTIPGDDNITVEPVRLTCLTRGGVQLSLWDQQPTEQRRVLQLQPELFSFKPRISNTAISAIGESRYGSITSLLHSITRWRVE